MELLYISMFITALEIHHVCPVTLSYCTPQSTDSLVDIEELDNRYESGISQGKQSVYS